MPISLNAINQMPQSEFVEALGSVFENTPAIAQAAWHDRPFATIDSLHDAMVRVMNGLSSEQQQALIRAHPDLGSKVQMTDDSVKEQASAGLNCLTPEEYQQFQQLNHAYQTQFSFPFIIAVKNHTKTSILAAFHQRLDNSLDQEQQQALLEIAHIARFRLDDRILP